MKQIQLYTIGFTKKTAKTFFNQLQAENIERIIDIRLHNNSQLSGFTKKKDLAYFLQVICHIDYMHIPELAPTKIILDDYKKKKGAWATYEQQFIALMQQRQMDNKLSPKLFQQGCLLCSEDTPTHCHRRLVAEYLQEKWGNMEIKHL